ncbi:thioredoxin domain-containing protein [Homoserinibacter sp. GY 40078]|uniref:thioredoxin domain-containing protein n=1 Tax=Homoserinibacter sp. GY 40078 TaxID=2603275 RepID=UPI0011CABDE1|nr:thioredoxin domain-containing protein [Homoserinibacter sp. GY 40078]TXK19349.1 thioredoxin domain-containing protein [Homoserinibacter sp. GY 40078]
MTYGESDRPEPGANDAREAAKERARELRTQHKKQERRRRLVLQLSVVGVSLVVLGVVVVTLVTMNQSPTRGPLNMASDGIKIGQDLKAVRTVAIKSGETPAPSEANPDGVIDIQLYVDYLCANCGTFEQNNSEQLRKWVEDGAATLEIHPIALLTTKSNGTQYSLRAANAAACVAEYSPDAFLAFHESLFVAQPEEGTEGLSDEELVDRAELAGATSIARIDACVTSKRFVPWVQAATVRALNGPIPGADIPAITTAPTILVDGKQLAYTKDFDPQELALAVTDAAGDQYTGTPTPSPTPTP